LILVACRVRSWVQQTLGAALRFYLCVYFALCVYHWSLYGQLPGLPAVYALFDTNGAEAVGFLVGTFNWRALLITFLSLMGMLILMKGTQVQIVRSRVALAYVLVAFGIAWASATHPIVYTNNPLLFSAFNFRAAIVQKAEFKKMLSSLTHGNTNVMAVGQLGDHIIIIGEALSKRHMQLYGYARETNPKLSEMKGSLFVDQNAYSNHGTTVLSLLDMLAINKGDNGNEERATFISLIKQAGYRVAWISNQQSIGDTDTWVSVLAGQADRTYFLNRRGWAEGVSFDSVVLPELENELHNVGPEIIFVHLLGSHAAYGLRYPPNYSYFNQCSQRTPGCADGFWWGRVNEYDNSVRYNDAIVAEIIKIAIRNNVAPVTYLSDHGESLGEGNSVFGHGENTGIPDIHRVPLLFYIRPGYEVDRDTLRANLNRCWVNSSFISTMSDLVGVRHDLFVESKSLFRKAYQEESEICARFAR
jgi:heptose-I-phosphate ethanolaminephosphotransferase